MKQITYERALELLQAAVDERGEDYIYPRSQGGGCFYTEPDGTPSCIVGLALSKDDPMWLQCLESSRSLGAKQDLSILSYALEDPLITEEAAVFMNIVQALQDEGHSWGDALKAARRQV